MSKILSFVRDLLIGVTSSVKHSMMVVSKRSSALVDLVHIVRAYSIFNDKMKAIQVCVNRFDDETKQAFLELYDKVDADVDLDKLEDKMYD